MSAPSEAPSGNYPIDSSHTAELERLRLQDQAWAPQMDALLDRIGVQAGWRCLDLGCGPCGATRVLSERVGPAGRVVGLEYNQGFAQIARDAAPSNVEIVVGDTYATELPDAEFDLVHMRFLASTSGELERLIAEAVRLVKPGGIFAMQEADGSTLHCYPPHPAWSRLHSALKGLFPETDGDFPAAHRHYRMLLAHGLEEVGYNPALVGVRSGDPWRDFLPSTAESARNAIIGAGLMTATELDRDVALCRAHLADLETIFASPMLVQVWGRKPG